MFYYFSNENLSYNNGTSATISILNWFLLHLLSLINMIPILGFIVWVVLYLMIGFRRETAPSIRNYIKFQVIIAAIVLVLTILLLLIGIVLLSAAAGE